jgi:hypothetical protein
MSKEYNEWYWRLYRWCKWNLPYQHKYFIYGVKNLYKWFWVIWKDREWDNHYIFEILKFKLENQANHLSERNWHENSKREAELIMTCVRLINKIQDESYFDEAFDSGIYSWDLSQKCMVKHNKAKRLLFKILNDRIENWWT